MAAIYNKNGQLVKVADQGILYPWPSTWNILPKKSAPFMINVLQYVAKPARVVIYVQASYKNKYN